MRRIARHTLNALTVIALLLSVTTLVLWARSLGHIEYWAAEWWREPVADHPDDWRLELGSSARRLTFSFGTWRGPGSPGSATAGVLAERQPHGFVSIHDRWTHWKSPDPEGCHAIHVTGQTDRRAYEVWELRFTHASAALATAAVPVMALVARTRRRRARHPNACNICGYDLRATPNRCPECGTAKGAT